MMYIQLQHLDREISLFICDFLISCSATNFMNSSKLKFIFG